MLPEHRRILHDIRTRTARQLEAHRLAVRGPRGLARQALRRERDRTARDVAEHRRRLLAAKAQAREFKAVWAQAKRDGRRLLALIDRHLTGLAASVAAGKTRRRLAPREVIAGGFPNGSSLERANGVGSIMRREPSHRREVVTR